MMRVATSSCAAAILTRLHSIHRGQRNDLSEVLAQADQAVPFAGSGAWYVGHLYQMPYPHDEREHQPLCCANLNGTGRQNYRRQES